MIWLSYLSKTQQAALRARCSNRPCPIEKHSNSGVEEGAKGDNIESVRSLKLFHWRAEPLLIQLCWCHSNRKRKRKRKKKRKRKRKRNNTSSKTTSYRKRDVKSGWRWRGSVAPQNITNGLPPYPGDGGRLQVAPPQTKKRPRNISCSWSRSELSAPKGDRGAHIAAVARGALHY